MLNVYDRFKAVLLMIRNLFYALFILELKTEQNEQDKKVFLTLVLYDL